jgi:chorismate mutase
VTISTTKLIIPFFTIVGVGAMWGQSTIDRLQPLVETSAQRLVLAKQVALAKWDRRAPVEDPTREAQVITAAAKDGELKGLDRTFVSNFFAAQIEANKQTRTVFAIGSVASRRRSTETPSGQLDR